MSLIDGKQLRDGSISGDKLATTATAWKDPVAVKHLVGNAAETTIEGLSPTQGDAYVVSAVDGDSTIDGTAAAVGDIFEYDGTTWQKVIIGSGGFPPAGTRALLATQTALIAPYVDSTDDGKIVEFSGSSLTGTSTGEAIDGYSVAVNGNGGVFEHNILVFSGTVPTGLWEGGGDIIAGAGLTKTVNTLNVGDANKGIQVNADDLEFAASEAIQASSGLKAGSNSWQLAIEPADFAGTGLEDDGSDNLRIASSAAGNGITGGSGSALSVDPDSETGGNIQAVNVTANGVGLDVSAIAGTGLEADGSANLRIATQGNGIGGGGGSLLSVTPDSTTGGNVEPVTVGANGVGFDVSGIAGNGLAADGSANLDVDPDSETGGNIQPVNVTANGVGVDINAIAGTGLEADGSANLRLATQGNGIAGGGGTALSVDVDSETGGNIQPVNLTANGVGVDIAAIAGNGLAADGSANLDVDPDSETGGNIQPVNVTANGVGVDINAIAGTGLEADGSANLRIAAQGNGLAGGAGTSLSVDPDSETGGNIQAVNVTSNGVGLDINAIAGSGLEADGSANLRIAASAAGSGLTGGGGAALAINTASASLTFTGGSWSMSPDILQIVGTPNTANDSVNKSYVDGLVSGISWRQPVTANLLGNVQVSNLLGSATVATINGLSPATDDAYVMEDSGTLTAGSLGVVTGDTVQYTGSAWVIAMAHSSNLPPAAAYGLMKSTGTLVGTGFSGYTNGDLVDFDGATLYGSASSPSAGHAYVVGDNTTVTSTASTKIGDLLEWSGSAWVELVTASGGYVPSGTRAVTGITPPYVLISPYVDATDDGEIVSFSGSSNTGVDTGDATDGSSVLFQDSSHIGYYDNIAFVFEGTTPTGSWIQFTGAGTINAGAGLTLTSNTIDVGDANKGVQVNADTLEIDASEIAATSGGLKAGSNSWQLTIEPNDFAGTGLEDDGADNLRLSTQGNGIAGGAGVALSVDPDSETGGNIQPVNVVANGVGVDISAIAGTGLEADGSANLRLTAQGNGIAGGSGVSLSVDPDSTTGGNIQPVNVVANGVGVDIAAIAGTGLEADGSANLRIATQGNGIAGGGGTALSVDVDSETGGNIQPVNLTANGVGVDIAAIVGNGLQADGSANLQVLANGTSISVSASGVKAAVPTSGDKEQQSAATSGNGQTTGVTIAATPAGDGYVEVLVNGVQYVLGDGVKTKDCYFSGDAGSTARAISAITASDTLYWNGVIAGFDLATTDYIDFNYNVIV